MIEECRGKDYDTRLRMVGLTSFETRMWRADMLEVFKILRGFEGLKIETFFKGMLVCVEDIHINCISRG